MANEKLIKKIKLDGTTYIIKDEAAYVKPSTGIPQSDLDQSTRTTLTTINDLLKNDDADTTVDTIREVLDVFAAYPEETTIVNALAGKAAVDHSHTLTPTTTTAVTAINSGSGSFTSTTRYLHETTGSAAPNAHTHSVEVSGTTGENSGTGVSVVTGVASNGTATALTGVKVTAQPTISLAENSSSATGRAQYVKSIDGGSGSLNVYSSDTTTTPETLPTSGRIPVVTGISGGSAVSKTTKYMKFTAGTTPKSGATPVHTSTNSSANSGTAVTALTGVKVTTQPTIGLTANASTATGRIQYVESISGGSGSLTNDGTSANGLEYVEKQGTFSAGTTPPSGASFSGTKTQSLVTSGTTKYMKFSAGSLPALTITTKTPHKITAWSAGAMFNASVSGTVLTLTAGTAPSLTYEGVSIGSASGWSAGTASSMNFNTGSSSDTAYISALSKGDYTPAGTIAFTPGTAPSMGAATTKYLHHTHTAASATTKYLSASASGTAVGANGTAPVAPSGHTHAYDKTTSITLTSGTAPAMNFNTGSSSDTPYISAVSGGSAVSATTKYLLHGHTGASATTRYMSATASGTGVGADGTATVLTGVKASGTATVAPNEHTHTFSDNATAVATTASPVTVITDLTANTTAATGDIAYLESATHTHTGASVKTTDTVLKSVTID